MSSMLPESLIESLRHMSDISVDIYGIECTLYIPSNWETVNNEDVYSEPQDYTYNSYETKIFIHWNPSKHRLLKYGIYTEDEVPILAHFSNKIKDDSGFKHFTEIPKNSYIQLPLQYVPNRYESDCFEIVDVVISNMLDSVVRKFYKLVPGRVKGRG